MADFDVVSFRMVNEMLSVSRKVKVRKWNRQAICAQRRTDFEESVPAVEQKN